MIARRQFLVAGAALPWLLAGCGRHGEWPEGMAPIVWDRDTCVRCKMVISDRRFAAQVRGGPQNAAFRFDDVGCAVFWMRDHAIDMPWLAEAGTRFWVADAGSRPEQVRWLEPRAAQYVTRSSPMGYNFAAVAQPQAGSVDFATMREHVLAKGK